MRSDHDFGRELTVRVADLSEGDGRMFVEVPVTGPGIAADLLAAVFDSFVTPNGGRRGSIFTIEFPVPSGRPSRVAP
jgi:hypothetical protein